MASTSSATSVESIRTLFRKLDLAPSTDEFHRIRSQIFSQIDEISRHSLMERVACLSKDTMLTHAENVDTDKIFGNYPAVHERLRPFANDYKKAFQIFQEALLSSPILPNCELENLIQTHTAFTLAYVEDYSNTHPTHPKAVRRQRPEDIDFFKEAIDQFLFSLLPEEKNEYIQKLKEAEPEVFLLIPKLGVLFATYGSATLPSFFEEYRTDIENCKAQYRSLSPEEQKTIHLALQGRRSSEGDPLIQRMEAIAIHSTRGDKAKLSVAIQQNILEDLK